MATRSIKRDRYIKYVLIIAPVLVLLLLWVVPVLEVAQRASDLAIQDKIELEDQLRATLAQIIGGLFLFSGAYFSWRSLVQNKEGQITDRFYKAVEQLGSAGPDNQAIRIGGIYALERIAKDSLKDHWPIMEVLCAYVRMHAPCSGAEEKIEGDARWESMSKMGIRDLLKPDPVIQTILTVLGRRQTRFEKDGERLDLRNTSLRGANLNGLNFAHARFDKSHLERADMRNADLRGATFDDARLEAAFLSNADLENASLVDAYLEGTDLTDTRLRHANLNYAHLQRTTPDNCDVDGARFGGANLTDVDLNGLANASEEQLGEAVVNLDPDSNELTSLKDAWRERKKIE